MMTSLLVLFVGFILRYNIRYFETNTHVYKLTFRIYSVTNTALCITIKNTPWDEHIPIKIHAHKQFRQVALRMKKSNHAASTFPPNEPSTI